MPVFGKDSGDKTQAAVYDLINRTNDNIRRLRVIEEEIKAINTRVNSIEQSAMNLSRTFQKSLADRDRNISSLEDRVIKIETVSKEIVKQMKMMATKSNVEEVRTLLNIYSPLESKFTTKEEVERMIEGRLSEKE
jgi:septal ring factor EnvC (AmiA/AmiB activator)